MSKLFIYFLISMFLSTSVLFAQEVEVKQEVLVFIKEFVIEGVSDTDELDELNELLLPHKNKQLSFGDMKKISSHISNYYKNRKYFFVKVLMPKQDISDGTLNYLVVKGKVNAINVVGNKYYSSDFIKNNFHLKMGDELNYSGIMKDIILLNEFSDLEVKSYFKKGSDFSTVDINLHVKDERPFHASILYDNLGSEDLAKNRLSVNISYGNLITDGDMISVGSTLGFAKIEANTNTEMFTGDYSSVIGYYHTKLHIGYLHTNYISSSDFSVLGMKGDTDIFSIGASQPIIRSTTNKVDLSIEYMKKDIKNYLLDSISSEEKLNVISPLIYWQYMDMFTSFISDFSVSKGFNNDDIQGSRLNENVNFFKSNLNLSYHRKITTNNDIQVLLRGQYSKDKLPVVEMYSSGGLSSVRGFRQSEIIGDSGFSGSLEWFYQPKLETDWFSNSLQLGLFTDYGKVYINKAVPGETINASLFGGGVELMGTIAEHYFSRLSLGYPISSNNSPYEESTHLYIVVGAKF